ncbi:MAG: iron donor protein CyaY [Burkholderiales bacterium]
MTETDFNRQVDGVILKIEAALDAADADLDYETVGGILEIECADGSRIIVNRQTPNREIWVAAKSGGFHFRAENGRWIDTRDGRELGAALETIIFSQSGEKIVIKLTT